MTSSVHGETAALRIDKWLWCARFFRSRALAAEAVAGGKVHVNYGRVKPSRAVKVGDVMEITLGRDAVTLQVLALPSRRGPATEARLCYEETAASIARRERAREQRRLADLSLPQTAGRPDKHTRRALLRMQRLPGGDSGKGGV